MNTDLLSITLNIDQENGDNKSPPGSFKSSKLAAQRVVKPMTTFLSIILDGINFLRIRLVDDFNIVTETLCSLKLRLILPLTPHDSYVETCP